VTGAAPRPASGTTAHLAFRAMSTDVTVTLVGGHPGLLDWARDRVAELEQRWSRFLPGSEISRLNGAGGTALHVSHDTVVAVRAACSAWIATHGCYDPTVHDSLVRLGYDDTIDVVRGRGGGTAPTLLPAPGCEGITFDESTGSVRLPRGVRLDLGGIGKGLAADLVVTGLLERGASGALVSVGGDLRVAGAAPNGRAWNVAIEDPRTDRPITFVELLDGGVATSTTLRRRWRMGQRPHHHLLTPGTGASTGASTTSDVVGVGVVGVDVVGVSVVGVSVVAGSAAWADALSKVPFVDDRRTDCFDQASCLVMYADGTTTTHGRFPAVAVSHG
jgi:thiamine biosynthesis lipoprotein